MARVEWMPPRCVVRDIYNFFDSVGNIADRNLTKERRQVVPAMAINRDASYHDEFIVLIRPVFEHFWTFSRVLGISGSPVILGERRMKLYRTTDFQVRRKSRRTRMSVVHRVDFYLPLALYPFKAARRSHAC